MQINIIDRIMYKWRGLRYVLVCLSRKSGRMTKLRKRDLDTHGLTHDMIPLVGYDMMNKDMRDRSPFVIDLRYTPSAKID